MKSKTKNILKWLPTVAAALVIIMGACLKLSGFAPLVELYSRIGLLPVIKILGLAELLFLGLFLYSRTMKMGFLLLTAYYGGAMAVELSHGTVFIFPATILTITWIGAYLRDRSLFKSVSLHHTASI